MKDRSKAQPTPNGGYRTEAYYLDDDNNEVDKSQATHIEVVEFDKDGNHVGRTYAKLDGHAANQVYEYWEVEA